ncbi:HlyD family efflux transporter periplasmic adaptor subunit [Comamonas piscis]|uniref:HlyD family efflux transporter periplasmic adaptor subunit n=1 Tax=Comamonas piscis TaxID=1562974 RepID=A0A7G5EGD5_9BURK|nr:HlyD family efflux transporter periplasmic adaptor subunit [Comamonas piscis]QMV73060.1 HlyD family efflux transporter periplasmic adaptor subunit [Comamonas piscis]WSO35845.1 HlyD family efflux transporter periplasmic adaptor subunit [Comamonas piscis]
MSNNNTPVSPSAAPAAPEAPAAQPRKKWLLRLTGIVIVLGAAYGIYDWMVNSHFEETDNAYVQGNLVQIAPQTAGTVQSILADDTDYVKEGQALVRLDPADAKVAFEQAKANLAQAVRQVRTLYVNNGSYTAQIAQRQAEVSKAKNDLVRAQSDLKRRQALTGNGAVSKEELSHAQSQVDAAQAAVTASQAAVNTAREQLASNQSLTEGISVGDHPNVLAAAAKVREAYLAMQRNELVSPVSGVVGKRSVQVGQRVAPGTPLMTVVPMNQLWVEANFKENQLRNLRLGQPVKMTADLYGKKVEYNGTVEGLGVGTGSAFSLLPAQNATGNWIKVVQRVPVRIALDAQQVQAHPLRVGLSMLVDVDIQNQDGKLLADVPRKEPLVQTNVYDVQDEGADAVIAQVIASNAGKKL